MKSNNDIPFEWTDTIVAELLEEVYWKIKNKEILTLIPTGYVHTFKESKAIKEQPIKVLNVSQGTSLSAKELPMGYYHKFCVNKELSPDLFPKIQHAIEKALNPTQPIAEREKEYEILSFKQLSKCENLWTKFYDDGWCKNDKGRAVTSPYKLAELLGHISYQIHSVKRLSDRVVFSIGDKITSNEWGDSYKNATIVRFDKSEAYNGIRVESSNGCNNDLYCIKLTNPNDQPKDKETEYEILGYIFRPDTYNTYVPASNFRGVANDEYKIAKVLRKKDNCIFSIGDEVDSTYGYYWGIGKISPNGYVTKFNNDSVGSPLSMIHHKPKEQNDQPKYKEPLFTEQDLENAFNAARRSISGTELQATGIRYKTFTDYKHALLHEAIKSTKKLNT